jgi:hypothetical protein
MTLTCLFGAGFETLIGGYYEFFFQDFYGSGIWFYSGNGHYSGDSAMRKAQRKIQIYQAEETGREEWIRIKKNLGLVPASLYQTMGPHWCNLWILKFKGGRTNTFCQRIKP